MPLTIPTLAYEESNMRNLDANTTQLLWELLNTALYDIEIGDIDDGVTAIEEAIKLIEGEEK